MRLSDKVAFVEKNEKLIVDAALDYRRSKCPETCDRFIVSLSLVWGGDEQGEGKFAYKDDEYEESIRVLRSMLEYSKTKFPSDFELVFAVTSDADDAVALCARATFDGESARFSEHDHRTRARRERAHLARRR